MTEILVFCDKDDIAFELLSWGSKVKDSLSAKLTAVVIGKGAREKAADYFAYGAEKVYWNESAAFTDFYADVYTDALLQVTTSHNADIILIGSTRRGKELASRLAQKLAAGCITDANGIELKDNDLVVSRYTLGGNTVSSEILTTAKKVISVLPKAFEKGAKTPAKGEAIEIPLKHKESKIKIVEKKDKTGDVVSLEEAQTLVCIGRGLNKKEDLSMVENLAKVLNAEIGCTRSLSHDWQWLSEQREVGLSGKKCKPNLCLELGISGQIQHTVGIRDSKIIVAINKDKTAPIFGMVDYGIVGDIYEVVPKLADKVKTALGK
jgi:electron transfer flavoprotein alpha subunit